MRGFIARYCDNARDIANLFASFLRLGKKNRLPHVKILVGSFTYEKIVSHLKILPRREIITYTRTPDWIIRLLGAGSVLFSLRFAELPV